MTQNPYGQRDATLAESELRGRMAMNPTGRQLIIDGSFVASLYTTDPADVLLSPPEGIVVMWNDSGTLRLRGFTRDTGWQTL